MWNHGKFQPFGDWDTTNYLCFVGSATK